MLNASIRDIPMPGRIKRLPINERGFPIPWFVGELNGKIDFRVIGHNKIHDAVKRRLCWLCGQTLGRYMAFVIGPMCSINRVSSEPPSHRDCAEYAVRACPFLARPNMRRNESDGLDVTTHSPGGIGIAHNPGVSLIWITGSYAVMRDVKGFLIEIGEPTQCFWYKEGRPATRAEIDASIAKGLPYLIQSAVDEGPEAVADLEKYIARGRKLLPAE